MRSSLRATLCALLFCACGWFASSAAAAEVTTVAITMAPAPAPDDRSANADIPQCAESGANVFWPVFLTLLVVLMVALCGYFFWKYYWSIRHGKLVFSTRYHTASVAYPDQHFWRVDFHEAKILGFSLYLRFRSRVARSKMRRKRVTCGSPIRDSDKFSCERIISN